MFSNVTVALLKCQTCTETEDISAEMHYAMQVYLKPTAKSQVHSLSLSECHKLSVCLKTVHLIEDKDALKQSETHNHPNSFPGHGNALLLKNWER